ncbi:MAG: triose-phosphate isomerase [Candidatus Taylorbacteria bacterium]|nr:triose-phosphate isomerase [Candidatus Taylorbacteria bacterium]
MKKRIIVGNWKMNPTTLDEAKRLFKSTKNTADKLKSISVVLCPPFIYIPALLNTRTESSVSIGAQDVYFESQGSFTGEVSPAMLKDMGVSYVIVGHSERRAKGETDEMVSKKVSALLDIGISPILCLGEKERNENGSHLEFLKDQIKNSLYKVSKKYIAKLIIAYEPVWAIGAKEAMAPEDIYEMSIFIRKVLADMYGHDEAVSMPVLYGGSVNWRDAVDIFVKGQIDGLLVGRESVNRAGFVELLKVADSI